MTRIAITAQILLAACGATHAGQPTVHMAEGYVLTVCETSISLTGNRRMAGVGVTTRWGCGREQR